MGANFGAFSGWAKTEEEKEGKRNDRIRKREMPMYINKIDSDMIEVFNGFTFFNKDNKKARDFGSRMFAIDVLSPEGISGLHDGSFDAVTMWHVLEHLNDPFDYAAEILRLLKPAGLFLSAVPNCSSYDAEYYGKFWAAYDVPRHLYHFDRSSVNLLAEQNGFKPVEVIPMKWDAYYISLLSERYKNQKQDYLKALFNGFRSNLSGKKNNMNYSSLIYILK